MSTMFEEKVHGGVKLRVASAQHDYMIMLTLTSKMTEQIIRNRTNKVANNVVSSVTPKE